MPAHQGKYQVKNRLKYKGNPDLVMYRSGWELSFLIWLDTNPDVVSYSSEELVIPYRCETDGRMHRYFPDFQIEFKDGSKYIIEIKPKKETVQPKVSSGSKKSKKTILHEALTWQKNKSKWLAAMDYAKKKGWIFAVWTEHKLKEVGCKIM